MARTLGDHLFVPVLLPAAMVLIERFSGHRLYKFLGSEEHGWRIVPHDAVGVVPNGWNDEDRALMNEWIVRQRFRAFMTPEQLACFCDPVVECENGKLVIRSGEKKIALLE